MTLFEQIVKESLGKELTAKANEADTNPTDAQRKAGNYKMGHINIKGFEITIENPKNSYRRGKNSNGKEWKTKMTAHYGYFTRTKGKDGDAIDVFVGEHPESDRIYVVDQVNAKGEFDESKVMFGYRNSKEAKNGYMSNYSKDWKGFKSITGVDRETFRKWLYDGHKQRKPFADYVGLNKINESYELLRNGMKVNENNKEIFDTCPTCGSKTIVLKKESRCYCSNPECGEYFGKIVSFGKSRIPYREDKVIERRVNYEVSENKEIMGFLAEDRHYPKFFDDIVDECANYVLNIVTYLKMEKKNKAQDIFYVRNNTCFDAIKIDVTITNDDMIKSGNQIAAYCGSPDFIDDKLIQPIIEIQVPKRIDKNQLIRNLRAILSHEVQHIFDDWMERKSNGESLNLMPSLKQDFLFRKEFSGQSKLYKACAYIAKIYNYTETKAYVAQTYQELSRLNATPLNYKSKIPLLFPYQVLRNIKDRCIKDIQDASLNEIKSMNTILVNEYPESLIPKYKNKEMSNMETSQYKEKLISWATRLYDKTLKKVHNVISLYLDDFDKANKPQGTPLIIRQEVPFL